MSPRGVVTYQLARWTSARSLAVFGGRVRPIAAGSGKERDWLELRLANGVWLGLTLMAFSLPACTGTDWTTQQLCTRIVSLEARKLGVKYNEATLLRRRSACMWESHEWENLMTPRQWRRFKNCAMRADSYPSVEPCSPVLVQLRLRREQAIDRALTIRRAKKRSSR